MKILAGALALVGFTAVASAEPVGHVEIMVVGTYHFDNPGLDMNNPKVDDVLKPERQEELRQLTAALATFRPNKIMVERVANTPELIDPIFTNYKATDLAKIRDERVQIAYRLASEVNLDAVYAIDEQASGDEPDYFPFQAVADWAKANDADDRLTSLLAKGAAEAKAFEAAQATQSIPQLLVNRNSEIAIATEQQLYYELLSFGGLEDQPGADLNAMWYLRNAKIFANLQRVARPGDRIVIVYGSGHNYWLRHFAETASGYQLIDPVPYLEKAAASLR